VSPKPPAGGFSVAALQALPRQLLLAVALDALRLLR
jgi:hypothetical protein